MKKIKTINIAILGFGVVGKGVFYLIKNNNSFYKSKFGINLVVKRILLKKNKKLTAVNKSVIAYDIKDIIKDKTIDIAVLVIGGNTDAKDYAFSLLKNKIHVVSANKAMICPNFKKLIKTAEENKVSFKFESSVGGGIPIINALLGSIAHNKLISITGILNGTANYVLSKMTKDNLSYDDALKLAQKLGFAESDPTDDVKGIDTANKLSILINLVSNKYISVKELNPKGIDKITKNDILKASKNNQVYKLVGQVSFKNNKPIKYSVAPKKVDSNSMLYNVNYENNAILVNQENLGEVLFQGKGAGAYPTASAIIADVLEIVC